MMTSAEPRKKKSNVTYASMCAILASMAVIIVGYGTHAYGPYLSLFPFCFL